nr:unnamed protein product [Spirometra erinaceieuropaei]
MCADDLKVTDRYKPADREIVLDLLKTNQQAFAQCFVGLKLRRAKGTIRVSRTYPVNGPRSTPTNNQNNHQGPANDQFV